MAQPIRDTGDSRPRKRPRFALLDADAEQRPRLFPDSDTDRDASEAGASDAGAEERDASETIAHARVRKPRKAPSAAEVRAKRDARATTLLTAAARAPVLAGFDMSYRSPGLVVVDRRGARPHYELVCLAQRKKQLAPGRALRARRVEFTNSSGELCTAALCMLPYPAWRSPAERYARVVGAMLEQLSRFGKPAETVAVIEDYAYSRGGGQQSSRFTQMCEAGGVLRHELWRAGIAHDCVSISSIKRWSTGAGGALKARTWLNFAHAMGSALDLRAAIPASWSAFESAGEVPSPHSDIADAYALVDGLHHQTRGGVVAPLPSAAVARRLARKAARAALLAACQAAISAPCAAAGAAPSPTPTGRTRARPRSLVSEPP